MVIIIVFDFFYLFIFLLYYDVDSIKNHLEALVFGIFSCNSLIFKILFSIPSTMYIYGVE